MSFGEVTVSDCAFFGEALMSSFRDLDATLVFSWLCGCLRTWLLPVGLDWVGAVFEGVGEVLVWLGVTLPGVDDALPPGGWEWPLVWAVDWADPFIWVGPFAWLGPFIWLADWTGPLLWLCDWLGPFICGPLLWAEGCVGPLIWEGGWAEPLGWGTYWAEPLVWGEVWLCPLVWGAGPACFTGEKGPLTWGPDGFCCCWGPVSLGPESWFGPFCWGGCWLAGAGGWGDPTGSATGPGISPRLPDRALCVWQFKHNHSFF